MSTFVVDDLTDPHELKRQYPNINVIQDVYKCNPIKEGWYIKLRRNGAYFWVKVTHVDGQTITGEIYHPLSCNAKFTIGDSIIFGICYAFDIYDPYTFELIPRSDQVKSMQ
jgi:hypothetical protein